RWNRDNANGDFGQNLRVRQDVANPNDTIHTDGGRYDFTTWAAKLHGTYTAPWNLYVTPAVRMQAVQPFGRTILASMNYGHQRILPQLIDSQRQDNIILVHVRVEKVFHLAKAQRIGVFVDGYTLSNANPASNITWSSGSSYLLPITIIAPRLARFGLKFD